MLLHASRPVRSSGLSLFIQESALFDDGNNKISQSAATAKKLIRQKYLEETLDLTHNVKQKSPVPATVLTDT